MKGRMHPPESWREADGRSPAGSDEPGWEGEGVPGRGTAPQASLPRDPDRVIF